MTFTKRLRERASRGNHLQRPLLDAPARESRRAIPDGERRDRGGFDREDRISGYHPRVGPRIRLPWCVGLAQSGEARARRKYLSDPIPLRASAYNENGSTQGSTANWVTLGTVGRGPLNLRRALSHTHGPMTRALCQGTTSVGPQVVPSAIRFARLTADKLRAGLSTIAPPALSARRMAPSAYRTGKKKRPEILAALSTILAGSLRF